MTRKHLGTVKSSGRRALAALGLRPPVVEVRPQGLALHDVTDVNPGMDRKARQSVTVEGSTITDISSFESVRSGIDGDSRYAGAYALPGRIDMHVHFRDPGFPEREDFETGTRAAAAGGVTTVVDMPNTVPSVTSVKALKENGARKVYAACTHGIFSGQAIERISSSHIDKIYISDTIPQSEEKLKCGKIEVLSVAKLFAQAIDSINKETSVSKLFL